VPSTTRSVRTTAKDGKILLGGTTGGILPEERPATNGHRWHRGGDNCVVPAVRRETIAEARAKLKASFCNTGRISRRFSNGVARGRVITTAPPPGDRRPAGTTIHLVVSRGKSGHRS
jgi:hypothetical protein